MKKIAIIGAGVGALTAGIKLCELGFCVDVFEKQSRENLAHPWMDDIRFDVFEYCGIEPPDPSCYYNKGKRLFISPDTQNSFHVPFSPPMVEISVERPALAEHFISLAEKAGVKIHFENCVESLSFHDAKVMGIVVNNERLFYDLVIDCSGLHSPFRAMTPPKFNIKHQPDNDDIMFAWRGFFNHREGTQPPETDRNIYIKHSNSCGLSWCNLNQKDETDVFVGRIGCLSEDEMRKAVADLKSRHDFFGDDELQKGRFAEISLCAPISRMVADGYVLLGDSAFMTMPMMGSGIEASMKAATWLCEIIKKYNLKHFTARNLWEYQVKYYKELGARYAFVDVVKRWLLGIDVELLNWLFGCGAVTDEDMGLVSTDNSEKAKLKITDIMKKAAIILGRPEVIKQSASWMSKALLLRIVASKIPVQYDEKKINEWQENYESLISEIKKSP